jgi:hypothetical protein
MNPPYLTPDEARRRFDAADTIEGLQRELEVCQEAQASLMFAWGAWVALEQLITARLQQKRAEQAVLN